jgi:integrase
MLLRTGLRVSEYTGLPAGDVALIGAGPWLHVPVGKLREDRYLPLDPQLVTLIDEYRAAYVPPGHPLLLPRRASAFGRCPNVWASSTAVSNWAASACASPRSRRHGPGDYGRARRHLRQPNPDHPPGRRPLTSSSNSPGRRGRVLGDQH